MPCRAVPSPRHATPRQQQDWFGVITVALYNIGDFIGVSLPSDGAGRLFRFLGFQVQ
jgi:hypothetical protein